MSASVAMPTAAIHRVAIIDDDYTQAETTALKIEEANFEPEIIRAEHPFKQLEDLAAEVVRTGSQAAVCDHRLTPQGFATFNGAPFVALLYDKKVPSVLITTYDMDVDVSIRKCRHKIPVLLDRDAATDPDIIRQGLLESARELQGDLSIDRRPHRSLVRVTNIDTESNEPVLDVIIPSWNPKRAVRFPLSLVGWSIQNDVRQGTRLFAQVNIGAEDPQELYFTDFELALEPDSNDRLT